jgi:hypothetical protein
MEQVHFNIQPQAIAFYLSPSSFRPITRNLAPFSASS